MIRSWFTAHEVFDFSVIGGIGVKAPVMDALVLFWSLMVLGLRLS